MKLSFKWIVPAVAIAAGAIWWGLTAYASNAAERQLTQQLAVHDLLDRITWRKVTASPFGEVRIHDALIRTGGADGLLKAKTVIVDDFIDKPDRLRLTVRIDALSDASGHSPAFLLGNTVGAATGRPALPPLDARLFVDADFSANRAELSLAIDQKDAARASAMLQIAHISGLRAFRAGDSRWAERFSWRTLDQLGSLGIRQLRLELHDDGAVERAIALYKRHGIEVSATQGNVKSQRDKTFAARIQAWEQQCQTERAAISTGDAKSTCAALANFARGGKRSLQISAQPGTPVPASELIQSTFLNPMRVLPLLNLRISH